jgi:hypothetical protein
LQMFKTWHRWCPPEKPLNPNPSPIYGRRELEI